ncbi:muscarinic acetylcholine receptor M3-like [Anneissia japonica]|uniref:muscarinic acetylcholine receptor M3-like n=1 Tax=Anneissia japonica TaxID=1529436 RepID=UPI00142570BC|nr:muscarinic acetylcholine receptor M3-like [Anneissia japonica]XP_033110883.1 muscarinic acetylcholine receptor M3-like [Anneissia japonica]XP_033110884.1 muscarinic acetylcholine receptor M3-like [Anneissia japonica]
MPNYSCPVDGEIEKSNAVLALISLSVFVGMIITIGGNVMVMMSFKIERRLHRPSNYFLLSLACADVIIGVFSMPIYAVYILLKCWPFSSFMCDLWSAVDFAVSEASVLNLIMISIDRVWSVSSPTSYRNNMTIKRAIMMIIPTWVCPILLYFTSIIGWPYFYPNNEPRPANQCYIQFMYESPLFMTISTICVFWIPLTSMVIMYSYIYYIIRGLTRKKRNKQQLNATARSNANPDCVGTVVTEQGAQLATIDNTSNVDSAFHSGNGKTTRYSALPLNGASTTTRCECAPQESRQAETDVDDDTSSSDKKLESKLPSSGRKKTEDEKKQSLLKKQPEHTKRQSKKKRSGGDRQSRSERKATRTLSFILGAFFLTWSPYCTVVIIKSWDNDSVPESIFNLSYWLCYINSTINPICYALANELFRNTFKKLLTCKQCPC